MKFLSRIKHALPLLIAIGYLPMVASAKVFGDYLDGGELRIEDVYATMVGLVCFFSRIAILGMVAGMTWYGFTAITSKGNPIKYEGAIKGFRYALLGALVILGTYTIIATVANFVGADADPFLFTC